MRINTNIYDPYTLPTIDFVGGSYQDLYFHVYFQSLNDPFDLSGCTANFSVIDFLDSRSSAPLISKSMEIAPCENSNILRAVLMPSDTVDLVGKFIYQITISERKSGKVEVPGQGFLYISNNIDKGSSGA